MNIEELSQIVTMMGGLGANVVEVFLLWVGLQVFKYLVGIIIVLIIAVVGYKLLRPLYHLSQGMSALKEVGLRMEVEGTAAYGELTSSDIYKIKSKILTIIARQEK